MDLKHTDIVNNSVKRKPRFLITGALAVVVVILIYVLVSVWHHSGFKVKFEDNNENFLAYTYYSFNNGVLKVASDSATYVNERNEAFWTISYDMTQPRAVICETSAAIYDPGGNKITICNKNGYVSTIITSMPIIKATVAADGKTAVIADDGTNAWVEYYGLDGNKISSVKTTMEATGYPYDAALSPNGLILAVSYISYEDSQMTSRIRFYSFTTGGGEKRDNVVNTYAYSGILIPDLEYIDNDTCVGFADSGFFIYKGTDVPKEQRSELGIDRIVSTLHGEGFFGLIVKDEVYNEVNLELYNSTGRRKSSKEITIPYTKISVGDRDSAIYNRNQIVIYSSGGTKKLDSESEELIREVVPLGGNQFVMITEEGFRLMALS